MMAIIVVVCLWFVLERERLWLKVLVRLGSVDNFRLLDADGRKLEFAV
jgi:hypothetical protein